MMWLVLSDSEIRPMDFQMYKVEILFIKFATRHCIQNTVGP